MAKVLQRQVIDEKYQKARYNIVTLVLRNIEIELIIRVITKVSRYNIAIKYFTNYIDRAIMAYLLAVS